MRPVVHSRALSRPKASDTQKKAQALFLCALLSTGALAQSSNPITGINDTVNTIGNTVNSGLDRVSNAASSLDSTISMLSHALDAAAFVPFVGAFAQILRPVLNTYLDLKITAQPIFAAMNRGRQLVKTVMDTNNQIRNLFTFSSFDDSVNNINALVNQFGGLANLPANLRKVSTSNVQADVHNILNAADAQIAANRQATAQAKASGDITEYRHQLELGTQLQNLRARLAMAGETAASQADNQKAVTQVTSNASAVASTAESQASSLQAVQSELGGVKMLGTIMLQQSATEAQGFSALSTQLAIISRNQTVTNEQNDQLLAHYQQEARKAAAQDQLAMDAQAERRQTEYKQMLEKVDSLSNDIGQTMKPDPGRKSDMRALMGGRTQ